jgi:VPS28 protein
VIVAETGLFSLRLVIYSYRSMNTHPTYILPILSSILTVQEFITCMDIIQLEQRAVDEIQPAYQKCCSLCQGYQDYPQNLKEESN